MDSTGPLLMCMGGSRCRDEFWDELREIRRNWQDAWLLAGDFNAIRKRSERLGVEEGAAST